MKEWNGRGGMERDGMEWREGRNGGMEELKEWNGRGRIWKWKEWREEGGMDEMEEMEEDKEWTERVEGREWGNGEWKDKG
ncbi:hypothetical protein H6P81_018290 [Aristolochia fimbriata]|uniref:Uncharacterized protein n=1 Tax=Aristolochia fimbriata TaxID=158543 RepID=A0AAV7E3K6_ARIFI|nr:hypothetical protein H6P81_018290 [Aristolochia fimbriata]